MGIGLAAVTLGLHQSALSRWWLWDDPPILKHAIQFSPWQYFAIPAAWQESSASNLMPWLTLSFDFDLGLFGLDPRAFYWHQLLVLWIAACATYALLRLWADPLWSGLGAALFVGGAPAAMVAQQLSARHYLEGLVFAILALYLYVRGLRQDRPILFWCGGVLYGLAITAKEVFVPLVMVLPFQPERDARRRWRAALPYLVVALAYVPWRWYMLGTPIGGYGHQIVWRAVLEMPLAIGGSLLGRGTVGMAAGLLALAAFVLALRRGRRTLLLGGAIIAAIVTPLVPVATSIQSEHRYLLLGWWAFCCVIALAVQQVAGLGRVGLVAALGVCSFLLGAALYQGWVEKRGLAHWIEEVETQGRFVWDADAHQVLVCTPPFAGILGYGRGLLWIRERARASPQVPRLVVDEIELAQMDTGRMRVWAYAEPCRCMRDISGNVPRILAEWEARRVVKPLSVAIRYARNVIAWQLGPYEYGTYSVIDSQSIGKVKLPTTGQERLALPASSYDFYIRYDSPDGWITYSPTLKFPAGSGGLLVWQR